MRASIARVPPPPAPRARFPRETLEEKRRRVAEVLRRLGRQYPDARCALNFSSPLELLVATILSAQCTDVRVNQVTPRLFRKYRTAADYARARAGVLEREIRETGFFNSKARSLRRAGAAIAAGHAGKVPRTMEELVALPGVGRKTANVILGNAFGIDEGMVVDTHVARVSRRLGWTRELDPVRIEQDLNALIPKGRRTLAAHQLIFHGRQICVARRPRCEICPVNPLCPKIGVLLASG
ncbi:MAG: endonuclease III [Thermoanaerobaculia bacterium]